VEHQAVAGLEIPLPEHGLLGDHAPGAAANRQGLLQPPLLLYAQQGSGRVIPTRTGRGIHPLEPECPAFGTGLPVAVLAVIHRVQHRQTTEGYTVIQP